METNNYSTTQPNPVNAVRLPQGVVYLRISEFQIEGFVVVQVCRFHCLSLHTSCCRQSRRYWSRSQQCPLPSCTSSCGALVSCSIFVNAAPAPSTPLSPLSPPPHIYTSRCAFQGAVYIFNRDPVLFTWTQVQKLYAVVPATRDRFGDTVAMDDEFLAVGAPKRDCSLVLNCVRHDRFRGWQLGLLSLESRAWWPP